MTEYTNDPCEKQELPPRPDPYAPDVTPREPQLLEIPTAAFPSRESAPIEDSTIRESVLLESNLILDENEFSGDNGFDLRELRSPEASLRPSSWENYPGPLDTFRYTAGKFWEFKNKSLTFLNDSFRSDINKGVFFDFTDITSETIGDLESTKVDLNLVIRDFATLRYPGQPIPNDEESIIEKMYYFVEGDVPLVKYNNIPYYDFCFKAPAAFFSSEAEQSSVPLVDTVSFMPIIGNLPLIQSPTKEVDLPSLYRIYNSINTPDVNTEVLHSNDKIQKFASSAVQQIGSITEEATNQLLGSQIFTAASQALNSAIRIQFNSNHESMISEQLKLAGLTELFLDYLSAKESVTTEDRHVQILDQSVLGGAANNRREYRYEPRTHVLDEFIDAALQSPRVTERNLENFIKEHPISYPVGSRVRTIEQLNQLGELERTIQSFKQESQRSYNQILSGDFCKSEIVAFRIEKLNTSLETLQEFYFFNDPDVSVIDFIDTQVKYNNDYNYRIYAINAVVGNEYRYKRSYQDLLTFKQGIDETGSAIEYKFEVENKPVIHLIETPYFENQIFMIDKPPIFPQVEIIPFFQDAERAGVRLTPTYGSISELPIAILEQDEPIIENMKSALGPNQSEILYTSDSQPTGYEALVLENEPFSYSDFQSAQRFFVEATYNSGYLEFKLVPNKRYYMTFRASDASGVSNPTAVYTLVLNSHADGIYVQFDEHEMVQPTLEEPITFERLLKIDPSPEQINIDFGESTESASFFESAPDLKTLSLGIESNKVWTKDYKFRLVSKTTGKAIDLNVTYDYKISPEGDDTTRTRFGTPDPGNLNSAPIVDNDRRFLEPSNFRLSAPAEIPLQQNINNNQDVDTEYDSDGRPVRSNVQADRTDGFPGIDVY